MKLDDPGAKAVRDEHKIQQVLCVLHRPKLGCKALMSNNDRTKWPQSAQRTAALHLVQPPEHGLP